MNKELSKLDFTTLALSKHTEDEKVILWFETLWSWADINKIDEDVLPRDIVPLLRLSKLNLLRTMKL